MTHSAAQFFQFRLVEADDDALSLTHDGAAQQVRLGADELDQFSTRRQLGSEVALFVNGVARIQKRRKLVVAKDRFDLGGGQRLFGVIAFDQVFLLEVLAQETPRVAAGGSGAFLPEVDFHRRWVVSYKWIIHSLVGVV